MGSHPLPLLLLEKANSAGVPVLHAFREHIWNLGAQPAIPPQRHEAPVACPDRIYNNRNVVEGLRARL